jgi:pSer/pThr/pTyr-binding forkhead associated (FHA) protein
MILALRELHPCRGRELHLSDGIVIGRVPSCEVALDDPLVSRRHARVLVSEIGAGIEDLDSANGVFVNGVPCRAITPLHPGDVIQLGGTLWLVARIS